MACLQGFVSFPGPCILWFVGRKQGIELHIKQAWEAGLTLMYDGFQWLW